MLIRQDDLKKMTGTLIKYQVLRYCKYYSYHEFETRLVPGLASAAQYEYE